MMHRVIGGATMHAVAAAARVFFRIIFDGSGAAVTAAFVLMKRQSLSTE